MSRISQQHFFKINIKQGKNEWNTPKAVFDDLNEKYHFTFDPCCPSLTDHDYNQNGLKTPWNGPTWCNMPYDDIPRWIKKGWMELCLENTPLIAFLTPLRFAAWFWFLQARGAEFWGAPKRLHFNEDPDPAPFDSLLSIITKKDKDTYLERLNNAKT